MANAVNVDGYKDSSAYEEEDEIRFGVLVTNFLISLRIFVWLVILLTVIGLLIGFLGSRFLYEPKYETGASFTVSSGRNSDMDYGFYSSLDNQLINSEIYIIQSATLKKMLVDNLGKSYEDLEISAEALPSTNLITLTVHADSKHKAYVATQQIISDFPKISQKIYGDVNVSLLDEVEVSNKAINASHEKLIILAGGLAGFVIALGIVFVYSLNLNLVPNAETLQKYENTQCIGQLPMVKFKNTKLDTAAVITNRNVSNEFKESFGFVKARTEHFCKKNKVKTMLVTSTFPSEGKTTVSVNLALSLSQNGKKVTIIDGDLRNPSIVERFGLKDGEFGLDNFLNGECDYEQAELTTPHAKISVFSCKERLEDAPSYLVSDKMKELIDVAKENSDYVIIDSPPTDVMGDSVTLCNNYADAAVFVVKQNYGKVNNVIFAIDSIKQTNAQLIGFVFNGVTGKGQVSDMSSYSKYSNYSRD